MQIDTLVQALELECQKQQSFYEKTLSQGYTLKEDNLGLLEYVGELKTLSVEFVGKTPKGFIKLKVVGEPNEEAFHIFNPYVLSHYNPNLDLESAGIAQMRFVVGVRRITATEQFVISLRLPFTCK